MSMTNEELVKLIKSGKQEYSEQLYKQNKGIILKHAKRYSRYADIDDLIQEGYIALIKAANGLICHGAVTLSEAFSNITGGDENLTKPEEFFCLQCV